jgi:magnesium-transporting ATPase (P-type)
VHYTAALLRSRGLPTPKHLPQVWVLTGDKLETAISIGVACRLLSPAMRALVLRNADFEGLQARSVSATCHVNGNQAA